MEIVDKNTHYRQKTSLFLLRNSGADPLSGHTEKDKLRSEEGLTNWTDRSIFNH